MYPVVLSVDQLTDIYCEDEDTSDEQVKAFTFRTSGDRRIRVTEHDVNRILNFPTEHFAPDPTVAEIHEFFQLIRTTQANFSNELLRYKLVGHWNFFFLTLIRPFTAKTSNLHGIPRPLQKIGYVVAHNRRINFGRIIIEQILSQTGPKEFRQLAKL